MRRAAALFSVLAFGCATAQPRPTLMPDLDELLKKPKARQMEIIQAYAASIEAPELQESALSGAVGWPHAQRIRWQRQPGESQQTSISFAGRPQRFGWWIWIQSDAIGVPAAGIHSQEVRYTWNGCVDVVASLMEPGIDENHDGVLEMPPLFSDQSNVRAFGECLSGIDRVAVATVPEPRSIPGLASGLGLLLLLYKRKTAHV